MARQPGRLFFTSNISPWLISSSSTPHVLHHYTRLIRFSLYNKYTGNHEKENKYYIGRIKHHEYLGSDYKTKRIKLLDAPSNLRHQVHRREQLAMLVWRVVVAATSTTAVLLEELVVHCTHRPAARTFSRQVRGILTVSHQVARICARAGDPLIPISSAPCATSTASTSYRSLGEQTTTASMLKVLQQAKRHPEPNFIKKSNLQQK